MNKITQAARQRRTKEVLQEQRQRNREQITALLKRNRKIDWALRLHEECEAHGITMGDQGDIDFYLANDDG